MSLRAILLLTSIIAVMFSTEVVGQAANETIKLNLGVKDLAKGIPAPGIPAKLYKQKEVPCPSNTCSRGFKWVLISEFQTDVTGRAFFPLAATEFPAGIYKFNFNVKSYFGSATDFYDVVIGVFRKNTDDNIPLLFNVGLSLDGYYIYQGSALH